VEYLCALLEPPLIRRVDRLGIHFPAVGPVVDYHGTRQPSIIRIDSVLDRLKAQRPEMWAAITDRDRLAPPRSHHWAAE
jgi:N-acyl amino acid synthase of PEP-CTERM/exosortase system